MVAHDLSVLRDEKDHSDQWNGDNAVEYCGIVVNDIRSERRCSHGRANCGLPERFATQEKAGGAALQASLRKSVEEMLILANPLVFVTRMALQANLPIWQTFQ